MKRRNRGQVLVLVALAIFVLLGLAALGIDVGFMYSVRHELQRSADAGALAGASRWIEVGSQWSSNPSDPVMVASRERAKDYAIINKVAPTPLDRLTEVAVDFPSQDRIRVTTQRTAPLFFARVLGRDNQVISATAVAEAAVADTGVRCLKPWGIPIPWNDTNPANDKFDPGESVKSLASIPSGYLMILKVGEPFNKKDQVDLTALQQESGHFFGLSLCADTGSSDYRKRIMDNCVDDCAVSQFDNVTLKPGDMVGPTRQAVRYLLDQDTGDWSSTQNTIVGSSYGTNWKDSPRFVKIPLYDPNQILHTGRTEMMVAGFGGFWLKGFEESEENGKPMYTVSGYYIGEIAPGGASGSGPGGGPVLRYLRLVE